MPDTIAVKTQKQILQDDQVFWGKILKHWAKKHRPVCGLFISDLQIPHQDDGALALLYECMRRLDHIDFITVDNDFFDNEYVSRWSQGKRPPDDNIETDLDMMEQEQIKIFEQYNGIAPKAHFLSVLGNHDTRLMTAWRELPHGESIVADWMKRRNQLNIIQFSRDFENAIYIGAGVLVHGAWSARTQTANAQRALRHFTGNGRYYSVVHGHTHRPSITSGDAYGFNGAVVVNSPALCRNQDISWLKYGRSPHWRTGFVVVYFKPNTSLFHADLIVFQRDELGLYAFLNGQIVRTAA